MNNQLFMIDQLISWVEKGLISEEEYNDFSDKLFKYNLQKLREVKADIQKDIRELLYSNADPYAQGDREAQELMENNISEGLPAI